MPEPTFQSEQAQAFGSMQTPKAAPLPNPLAEQMTPLRGASPTSRPMAPLTELMSETFEPIARMQKIAHDYHVPIHAEVLHQLFDDMKTPIMEARKMAGSVVGETGKMAENVAGATKKVVGGVANETEKVAKGAVNGTEALAKMFDQKVDAFHEYAKTVAQGLFPTFAPQIKAGIPTSFLLEPYRQVAKQMLGHDTELDFHADPKAMAALRGGVDPATGRSAPMDMDQWKVHLMKEKAFGWERTPQAHQVVNSILNAIKEGFGFQEGGNR